jgi:hypothetical protein
MANGPLEGIFSGAVGAYGYSEMMNKLQNQRQNTGEDLTNLQTGVDERTQFQPWSIKGGGIGSIKQDADGMQLHLTDRQKSIRNQMFQGGQGLMGQAEQGAMNPAAREAEIYERIRAMQRPGEERGYNQMNEAAMRQGRTGMGTAQYGGSPEQMAFAQAQAEARNTAGYQSMGQAQQEIGNQFQWGQGMLNQSYVPINQLLNKGVHGMQGANMAQDAQMNNANLWSQLGLGGITADTNFSNIEGNAFGNMIQALMGAAGGAGSWIDNL